MIGIRECGILPGSILLSPTLVQKAARLNAADMAWGWAHLYM